MLVALKVTYSIRFTWPTDFFAPQALHGLARPNPIFAKAPDWSNLMVPDDAVIVELTDENGQFTLYGLHAFSKNGNILPILVRQMLIGSMLSDRVGAGQHRMPMAQVSGNPIGGTAPSIARSYGRVATLDSPIASLSSPGAIVAGSALATIVPSNGVYFKFPDVATSNMSIDIGIVGDLTARLVDIAPASSSYTLTKIFHIDVPLSSDLIQSDWYLAVPITLAPLRISPGYPLLKGPLDQSRYAIFPVGINSDPEEYISEDSTVLIYYDKPDGTVASKAADLSCTIELLRPTVDIAEEFLAPSGITVHSDE